MTEIREYRHDINNLVSVAEALITDDSSQSSKDNPWPWSPSLALFGFFLPAISGLSFAEFTTSTISSPNRLPIVTSTVFSSVSFASFTALSRRLANKEQISILSRGKLSPTSAFTLKSTPACFASCQRTGSGCGKGNGASITVLQRTNRKNDRDTRIPPLTPNNDY